MGTEAKRVLLQAKLTPEARAGWMKISREHGVSVTALIEALGLWALHANEEEVIWNDAPGEYDRGV